jgi:hypothetical protein
MQQQLQQFVAQAKAASAAASTSASREAAAGINSLPPSSTAMEPVASVGARSTVARQQEQQQQADEQAASELHTTALVSMAQYLSGKRSSPPWDLLGPLGRQPYVCGQPVNLRMLFLLVCSVPSCF